MGFSLLEMENEGDLGLYICIPKQASSSRDMLSNNVDLYRVMQFTRLLGTLESN